MTREKLMNLVIDPTIQVREVNPFCVSKYAQAMRSGAQFPPLVIEEKTNRIVCGNNRYFAYKKAFEPEHEVEVEFRKFKNDADIIRFAAKDNSRHGLPMDTWDMKQVAARLKGYGDTPAQIAEVLSVPVARVEEWAGMTIFVIGKRKKPELRPLKAGMEHLAGSKIEESAYNDHATRDKGDPIKNLAAQITRHINSNLINTEDFKTMESLRELHAALNSFFEKAAA